MLPLIICLFMGGLLIFLSVKGFSLEPIVTIAIGILFIIIGIVGFLLSEDIIVSRTGIIIGVFIFSYSLAIICTIAACINLRNIFCTRTKITATLKQIIPYGSGLKQRYALLFTYFYGHRTYTQQTSGTIGMIAVKKLEVGKDYTIFINEKNPQMISYNHKIDGGTWCIIGMTIALYLVPFIAMNAI